MLYYADSMVECGDMERDTQPQARPDVRYTLARIAFVGILMMAYVWAFFPLYRWVGSGVPAALSAIPVIAAGWFWGVRAGLSAGVLLSLLNAVLLDLVGYPGWEWLSIQGVLGPGNLAILIVGVVTGRLRDLTYRIQGELSERDQLLSELAIERENLQQQYHRQAALAEIEMAINQPHELQSLLDRVVEVTTEYLPASGGASVVLWDPEEQAFTISSSTVQEQDSGYTAVHVRRVGGATRWIVDHRQPLIVPDIRDDPFGANPMLQEYGLQSYAGFPLLSEGEALGVLYALGKQAQEYTQDDQSFLGSLANRAAAAITKVRLSEQAQMLATLNERQRLARELHDVVSQTLFSASVLAEALPRLWERDPGAVKQGLSELENMTRGALAEMRTLLFELRPSAFAEVALSDLIRLLVDGFKGRSRVEISLEVKQQCQLPPEVKITFFRIAQEVLNNIVKHAHANRVDVRLSCLTDQASLYIRDDGRGFDTEPVPPGHLGLGIMRERSEAIDATLTLTSQPGHGTQVDLVWQNTYEGQVEP